MFPHLRTSSQCGFDGAAASAVAAAACGTFRAKVNVVIFSAILWWCLLSLPPGGYWFDQDDEERGSRAAESSTDVADRDSTLILSWFTEAHTTNPGCDGRSEPRPGAIYSAVGHVNYGVGIDLRPDIGITGGCEVNLPIEVCIKALERPYIYIYLSTTTTSPQTTVTRGIWW